MNAEEIPELSIEVHRATLRMLDRADEHIGERAESFGKKPQRNAFACAGVAGKHRESTVCDAELDAPQVAVNCGGFEKSFDGDVGSKGVKLQAVKRKQLGHGSSLESEWVSSEVSFLAINAGGSPVAA